MCINICTYVYKFIYSFSLLFFINLSYFFCIICSYPQPYPICPYSSIHSFIHTFIHSFIPLFMHSYIHSYIHSFIHSFIHSYIHSFIYSFIYSFIHSFIHLLTYKLVNLFTPLHSSHDYLHPLSRLSGTVCGVTGTSPTLHCNQSTKQHRSKCSDKWSLRVTSTEGKSR
jgi:hypothetical protein